MNKEQELYTRSYYKDKLLKFEQSCPKDLVYTTDTTSVNLNKFSRTKAELDLLKQIDKAIQDQWKIDTYDDSKPLNEDEKYALSILKSTRRLINRHYQVSTLWKKVKGFMPNNRPLAEKRFSDLRRRLHENQVLKVGYAKVFQSWIEQGYVERVPKDQLFDKDAYYLPHFAVVRTDRATSKIRPVFDAAAKYKGYCLNDFLLAGPNLLNDLPTVLTRFRRNRIAIGCDIGEMFLRIKLHPDDKKYHRFFWLTDPEDMSSVAQFQFSSHVFGNKASPNVACYTIKSHAVDNKDKFPLAHETVVKSTIMDDSLDSVNSQQAGIQLVKELTELFKLCSMRVHKWIASDEKVLLTIPVEDRSKDIDINVFGNKLGIIPTTKTLGMVWIGNSDYFSYNMKSKQQDYWTKRLILSCHAQLYDPLGLISPFIIMARIIMQDIWKCKYNWDDNLQERHLVPWIKWYSDMSNLPTIRIKRCLRSLEDIKENKVQLHCFTDASAAAFAATVYLRITYIGSKTISSELIRTKSRVTPMNQVSIPRLELLAAVLGIKTAAETCISLSMDMAKVAFWTDSTAVLGWIRNQSRNFQTFVANRVSFIQERSDISNWKWVSTNHNPADLASRGVFIADLAKNTLWWNGPEFLLKKEQDWPAQPDLKSPDSCKKELKKGLDLEEVTFLATEGSESNSEKALCDNCAQESSSDYTLSPFKYSSWLKTKRVLAYIMRFKTNLILKIKDKKAVLLTGELSPEEIKQAEYQIILECQKVFFKRTLFELKRYKSLTRQNELIGLEPLPDQFGLLRVNARLREAEFLSIDQKCPLILPKNSVISRLIASYVHRVVLKHIGGCNQLMATLNKSYYIFGVNQISKDILSNCIICKKQSLKSVKQKMALLPDYRINPSVERLPVFYTTGLDCAGPFETTLGRKKYKRYLVLFVCCQFRAVHIEMLESLNIDSFLSALSRFLARRPRPKLLISDNGGNFVGANNELIEIWNKTDESKLINSDEKINWNFHTPYASHTGGHYERLIQSVKRGLFKQLKGVSITDEQLNTAMIITEGILNSRPIGAIQKDPNDLMTLTPAHFLNGAEYSDAASIDKGDFKFRRNWYHIQSLMDAFWVRLTQERAPLLNAFSKWTKYKREFKIGDIVMWMNSDKRAKWLMGRVVSLKQGEKDGLIRSVEIKVKNTTYWRCTQELTFLDV